MSYTPTANTVAYYPLKDNFNDYSWNSKNLRNSWSPTITTVDWIKCAYYNWNSYSSNTSISAPIANRTIACYFKTTQTTCRIFWVWSLPNSYGDYWQSWLQISVGSKTSWNIWFDNTQWANGTTEAFSFDNSKFICVVMAQSWNSCALYINWEYKTTYTNLTTTWTSATWTMVVLWAKANYDYSEKFTGYIWSCVVENKTWSVSDVNTYWNATKADYWYQSDSWIYIWTTEITRWKIYVWTTPVTAVYVGTTKVRPSSRLPSAYQEVEWIGRNGNNYIDTWWVPKYATAFEVKVWYKISTTWTRYWIISNYNADNLNWEFSYEINASNKVRFFWQYNPWQELISSNTLNTSDFNDIVLKNNTGWSLSITLNWPVTSWTIANIWYQNISAYLFIDRALRWSTFTANSFISYCKIYESWTLIRDFVPCYRKSDSVIWMYDLVNNQFYTNSWSGTFTKWPDV